MLASTENSGGRRANRSRTRALDTGHAKTAGHATSSRRLVVTTHKESRDADSESFRTGMTCQNGGNRRHFGITEPFWLKAQARVFLEALQKELCMPSKEGFHHPACGRSFQPGDLAHVCFRFPDFSYCMCTRVVTHNVLTARKAYRLRDSSTEIDAHHWSLLARDFLSIAPGTAPHTSLPLLRMGGTSK